MKVFLELFLIPFVVGVATDVVSDCLLQIIKKKCDKK